MGHANSSLSLGVKSSSGRTAATNNVPPLLFHPVHGDNIRLSEDGRCARRVRSYCHGIVFSNRPVAVNERVVVKLVQVSDQWSGVVRLGFTTVDPRLHTAGLPKYSCPDLTSKPGFWAKAMSERFVEPGRVLFFFVTSSGDMHLGVDGAERGVFLSGVDTSRSVWAIVDVYGNATALQIVHAQRPVPVADDQLTGEVDTPSRVDLGSDSRLDPGPGSRLDPGPGSRLDPGPGSRLDPGPGSHVDPGPGSRLDPGRQTAERSDLRPSGEPLDAARPAAETPEPQPFSDEDRTEMARLKPLPLNSRLLGGSVSVSSCATEAVRGAGDDPGYVLSAAPLPVGGRLCLRLLATGAPRCAGLTFGLTSCDPASLSAADLPADPDLLPDRPEYWPLVSEVVAWPMSGERLSFGLAADGAVTVSRDGCRPRALMHVDASLPLWPVLALTGAARALRVLGVDVTRESRRPDGGGERAGLDRAPDTALDASRDLDAARDPAPSATVNASPNTSSSSAVAASRGVDAPPAPAPSDCSICLDRACDAALYACGHVCLCYACAVQWRARGTGLCPLCCAPIRDVIRLYHS